jgi:hypothetical protein
MASDVVFVDNIDKKSFKDYIYKLFNGPVDWSVKK